MSYALKVIFTAHLFLFALCVISILAELIFNKSGYIHRLFLPGKTQRQIERTSKGYSLLYFVVNLIWLWVDAYFKNNAPESFRFWQFLMIIVPLNLAFRHGIKYIQDRFNQA